MKKNYLLAIFVALACFVASNVNAQAIPEPQALSWFLVGCESAAEIPWWGAEEMPAGINLKLYMTTGSLVELVDNPKKDLRNKTDKALKLTTKQRWDGWVNVAGENEKFYIDMSRWEKLSFSIYTPDFILITMQLQVRYWDGTKKIVIPDVGGVIYTGLDAPMSTWTTLNFTLPNASEGLKKVHSIAFWINPWTDGAVDGTNTYYIDNLVLTRTTIPAAPSGIEDVQKPVFSVHENTNNISLKGVSGKISILNVSGVQVSTISNYEEGASIDISSWSKGLFIIKTEVGTAKFLKK